MFGKYMQSRKLDFSSAWNGEKREYNMKYFFFDALCSVNFINSQQWSGARESRAYYSFQQVAFSFDIVKVVRSFLLDFQSTFNEPFLLLLAPSPPLAWQRKGGDV